MKQLNEKMDISEKHLYVNLYKELQKIKNSFKVTNAEICAGLKISRTPLDTFFNTMEQVLERQKNEKIEDIDFCARLDFNQVKLINLVKYLVDEDNIKKGRQNFEEIIKLRKGLNKDRLNELLEAAKCQKIPGASKKNIDGVPIQRHSQVRRIISRFSSFSIPDDELDHVFTNTLDIILRSLEGIRKDEPKIDLNDAEFAMENGGLIKVNPNEFLDFNFSKVKNTYTKAIRRFVGNGKTSFSYEEIHELYFNIKEAELLGINDEYRIRVENCQFTNLSNSHFQESMDDVYPKIKKALERLGFKEHILMSLESPVTMATVNFRFKNLQSINNIKIRGEWISISNHSPVDSTIKAVLSGLGCPLELKNLFVLNLGNGAGSFRRVSITLIDQISKKTFHGMWVDVNIVVGIAQSTIAAIESWIKNEIGNEIDSEMIRNTFHKIHEISCLFCELDRIVYRKLNHLNNYIISENTNELIDGIQNQIAKIKLSEDFIELKKILPKVGEEFSKFLSQKNSIFKWIELDFNKKKLNILKLKSLFNEIKESDNEFTPSIILYRSEEINFKFICSDENFLKRKMWRIRDVFMLKDNIEKLIKYVDNLENGHYRMRDYFTSLSVSEIIGNISRLELYFCDQKEDIELLQHAAENLTLAAYFSSRIGLRQKSVGWLSFAARSYIRLGEENKASDILKIARIMIEPVIDVRMDHKYQYAVQAEIYLAEGELAMTRKEYAKSVELFTKALIGSIHIGHTILSADILFGLSRTCISKGLSLDTLFKRQQDLGLVKNLQLIERSFKLNEEELKSDKEDLSKRVGQEIVIKLQSIQHGKSLSEYESTFKLLSQYVWNKCCEECDKERHLISKMIEDKTFLKSFVE